MSEDTGMQVQLTEDRFGLPNAIVGQADVQWEIQGKPTRTSRGEGGEGATIMGKALQGGLAEALTTYIYHKATGAKCFAVHYSLFKQDFTITSLDKATEYASVAPQFNWALPKWNFTRGGTYVGRVKPESMFNSKYDIKFGTDPAALAKEPSLLVRGKTGKNDYNIETSDGKVVACVRPGWDAWHFEVETKAGEDILAMLCAALSLDSVKAANDEKKEEKRQADEADAAEARRIAEEERKKKEAESRQNWDQFKGQMMFGAFCAVANEAAKNGTVEVNGKVVMDHGKRVG